ncbi:MAG TPA: PocR ligand-binding domain-containing protein [Syntrophales bacterium]|nr:PocR ligand-binding domain-containing protein [Syntrophales bacterium]
MVLTDIAPLERWAELEKEIHRRSALNASVFDIDGIRITNYTEWANRLCPAVKANEKGQSYICSVAHQHIASQAMRSREPVIAECDGGLIKLAVPIFVEDEFLGVVGGCGHLPVYGEVETFLISKTTGIDEKEIEELSHDMKTMSEEEATSTIEFIRQEVDEIVRQYVVRKSGN